MSISSLVATALVVAIGALATVGRESSRLSKTAVSGFVRWAAVIVIGLVLLELARRLLVRTRR